MSFEDGVDFERFKAVFVRLDDLLGRPLVGPRRLRSRHVGITVSLDATQVLALWRWLAAWLAG